MKSLSCLVFLVIVFAYPQIAGAAYDWRFADPNSTLVAGSTVTPNSSNPVAYFFISGWTPLNRLPSSFAPLLSKIQTVTYSSVTSKLEVTVLTGTFDLAAVRSAAGAAGMKSQTYQQVEILASQTPSRDQIALVNTSTIVFGGSVPLRSAIDRWIANSNLSGSNALIQQSATFASGWDMFALSSGSATMTALLNQKSVKQYLSTKAPTLATNLAASLGFSFRARTQSNFRAELNITEPDSGTASTVASGLAAIPGQIKATGVGVIDLLQAVNTFTSVTSVGSVVELVMDPNLYTLTTVIVPSGAGTVSPATAGVIFAANSVVTLTATPGACYGTATWSTYAPGGVVTMTGPQIVTVTFANGSAAAEATVVMVTPGGIRLNQSTGRYQQVVTLTNPGAALANVSLILTNLPAGVSLYNASGSTFCAPAGRPYLNLANLPTGWTSVVLEFSVANAATPIQYAMKVLEGSGTR